MVSRPMIALGRLVYNKKQARARRHISLYEYEGEGSYTCRARDYEILGVKEGVQITVAKLMHFQNEKHLLRISEAMKRAQLRHFQFSRSSLT